MIKLLKMWWHGLNRKLKTWVGLGLVLFLVVVCSIMGGLKATIDLWKEDVGPRFSPSPTPNIELRERVGEAVLEMAEVTSKAFERGDETELQQVYQGEACEKMANEVQEVKEKGEGYVPASLGARTMQELSGNKVQVNGVWTWRELRRTNTIDRYFSATFGEVDGEIFVLTLVMTETVH